MTNNTREEIGKIVDNLRPIIKSPSFSTGIADIYIHKTVVIETLLHQLQKAREEVLETLKKEILSCVTAKGDDCYFLRVDKNSPLFSHPELDQPITKDNLK